MGVKLGGYAPILLMLAIAIILPIAILTIQKIFSPSVPNDVKYAPYECGLTVTTEAREKFGVKYYLIAVIFLVFDVETVFLMPWAIQINELAIFGLVEMGFFLFLLLFGYGYVWSKGALSWE
ncbi:MAG: NADH-quinone oxidoreductase subunit A [Holophagaceae bacterium]|nr:NADH-quinone oxidoreductase subunit A [Holophagaceae bacterium]